MYGFFIILPYNCENDVNTITILTYYLTGTLNWQVLWGREKYLLNILNEKLKNKISLKQM